MKVKRLLRRAMFVLAILFLLIQFVPMGRSHPNPPLVQEPVWDSPRTRELAVRACFDCHSNETSWPWYAWIAPVSWLLENDVEEGREHLNFSEWKRQQRHADEAAEELEAGAMPLWFYPPLHSAARLTAAEKAELAAGLLATCGGR